MAAVAKAAWPDAKFVDVNGIRMAYHELGSAKTGAAARPPVIFLHGFPELAFSWRHQLGPVAAAGFRAIAPDQRGYGHTTAPEGVEAYDMAHLTGDVVALMDALEIEKAIVCGHDWGANVAWGMPQSYPSRVAGVIGVNLPLLPRSPIPTLEMMRKTRGEKNYIVQFQEPGTADAVMAANVENVFRVSYRKDAMTAAQFAELPPDAPERNFELLADIKAEPYSHEIFVSEEELKVYVDAFRRTGFTGGINWYRNLDRNWAAQPEEPPHISQPCLYIGAEDDVILPPSMADGMETMVPDLEKYVIKGCGHWSQQQKPNEFNDAVIDWLKRKFGPGC